MSFAWLLQIPDILDNASLLIKFLSSLQARFRGDPYEVLENEIELELVDTKGKLAKYRKKKKIRFLQNNIFAYLDTAFGNGSIFEDYQCSPGKAVDCYEEAYRYRVLISLQEMKQRGDEEVFNISRSIRNGYLDNACYLQTDIAYPTRKLEVRLIFPKSRPPKKVSLLLKNRKEHFRLKQDDIQRLSDGRSQVIWQKKNPQLYEGYILTWEW